MRQRSRIGLALAAGLVAAVMGETAQAFDNTGSGGTITYTDSSGQNPRSFPPYVDGYVIHAFNGAGITNLYLPVTVVGDVLVVAGGGSGGVNGGGGGGAGGVDYVSSYTVAAGSHYVQVGAGGVCNATYNSAWTPVSGGDSAFDGMTVRGGGGGAARDHGLAAYAGGSGGGGGGGGMPRSNAGSGTSPQGSDGGNGSGDLGANSAGGGGGGKGGTGGTAASQLGGNGGVGAAYTVFAAVAGSPAGWFAGGGGGGITINGTQGTGGTGGGGSGAKSGAGANGSPNTGGGGGGGGAGSLGGSGGSGVVLVRYPYAADLPFTITLVTPEDNQSYSCTNPVIVSAVVAGGIPPYAVTFHRDANVVWSTNSAPGTMFSANLGALVPGSYTVRATVTDSAAPTPATASSATHTITSIDMGNTGYGGTIVYTDPSGLNPRASAPYLGGYVIHVYTNAGANTLSVPVPVSADVLVVAGGGSGGAHGGGGGGAGGVVYTSAYDLAAMGVYNLTVGTGAVGRAYSTTFTPTSGGDSTFDSLTAIGGGGGAGRDYGPAAYSGGSGGGGGHGGGLRTTPGNGTSGQGSPGGNGYENGSPSAGGGGGGKGGTGLAAAIGAAGNGGTGGQYQVFAPVAGSPPGWFAGGGGGGLLQAGAVGAGGTGGGGAGSIVGQGVNGMPHTGGGGGAGSVGGTGGSGIVLVRYPFDNGTLAVMLFNPTNRQTICVGPTITATAKVVGGPAPYAVTVYTNSAVAWTTNNAMATVFDANLGVLPPGTYTISVKVTDGNAATATTATNTLTIVPANVVVAPTVLSDGQRFVPRRDALAAGGGTAPYTFAVTSGSLPPGMGLSAAGLLSGTPDSLGTFTFTVQATDAYGYTGRQAYTLNIVSGPLSFFWTRNASGSWSAAENWTNETATSAAPSSAGSAKYALNFNAAGATYNAMNDLADGFMLNQLNFGGAAATLTGTGMTLTNDGANLPQVNQNSAAAVLIGNKLALSTNVTFGGSGNGTVTLSGALGGRGGLINNGPGTVVLASGNTHAGETVLAGGTLVLASQYAAQNSTVVSLATGGLGFSGPAAFTLGGLTGTGNIGLVNAAGAAVTLSVGNNGASTAYAGSLSGSGGIVKVGPGTLTLSGDSSFTGALTLSAGSGTAILSGNNSARPGGTSGLTVINSGSTLQLQANAANTVDGISYALSQEQLANQPLLLNNGGTLQLRADSDVTFAGANNFGGLGNATVTIDVNQLTAGNTNHTITLAPGGYNTSTTIINVEGGNGYTLHLGNLAHGGPAPLTFNANTANLDIDLIGTAKKVSGLAVGGAANTTLGGLGESMSNPGTTLTKTGTGTLTLTRSNAYAGATTVGNGTLRVNGSTAAASAVTIKNGGTLAGSGTVNGTVTVQSGGTLSAGGSGATAVLTVNNNVTFQSASVLLEEIRGETAGVGYDQLSMTGALQLGNATLRVALADDRAPPSGTVYTIISGCASMYGTFAGLPEGGQFEAGECNFMVHYNADAGTVTLTAYRLQGTVLIVR